MSETAEHTPGPWGFVGDESHPDTERYYVIGAKGGVGIATTPHRTGPCTATDGANAKFIVRACNSHDRLVEACEAAGDYFAATEFACNTRNSGEILDTIRAALADARKGE